MKLIITIIKNCKLCNKVFKAKMIKSSYCSRDCYKKQYNDIHKNEIKIYNAQRKEYKQEYDKIRHQKLKEASKILNRFCKYCGQNISNKNKNANYCSNKCYKKDYSKIYSDEISIKQKQYRENHKDEISTKQKEYRKEHKDEIKKTKKKYAVKNRTKINEHQKERSKKDINYRIRCNLRKRLNKALKNNYKSGSAVKDLGCSIEYLMDYIGPMFYLNPKTGEMMSWDNYGLFGWHIDHIIPLDAFDLTDREQLLKACNFKNLQPLWAEDNLKKGDKLP